MKTYFQPILGGFQIIEMSNKNTWIYSIMLHIAHLKQPRYLLNYSQDFGIPGVFGSFYRDWVWEGNTGGAGGGGHWHNTTASTTTQVRYSTTRGHRLLLLEGVGKGWGRRQMAWIGATAPSRVAFEQAAAQSERVVLIEIGTSTPLPSLRVST